MSADVAAYRDMLKEKKEPEIFETPDSESLPVEDNVKQEKKSEDIITTPLRPELAFETFAGKIFDTTHADFSDSSLKRYLHKVSSFQTEYANYKNRTFETPLQRYTRLKAEVDEFQKDLQSMAESSKGSKESIVEVSKLISHELASVDAELQSTLSNQSYQPYFDQQYRTPGSVESTQPVEKLLEEVKEYGAKSKGGAESKSDGSGGGKVTYKLYFDPKADTARQQMNVADVDRRVAALERTLGTMNDAKALGYPDVHSALQQLQRRSALMDAEKLKAINNRIKALMGELEGLEKARAASQPDGQSEHQEKVAQIFDLMTKWDQAAEQLPAIVARLQSLRELHEESAAAVLRIQAIDAGHEKLETVLKDDKEALKRAEASLSSNMKTMENNVKSIDARFKALEAKMAQL